MTTQEIAHIISTRQAQGFSPLAIATQIQSALKQPKYNGFDYILTFNHKVDETPTVRHSINPETLIRMARMVVFQYPEATWFVIRRADGVCLAQSK